MTTESVSWDELRCLLKELIEQGKETDRRMQETDRRMQETDRRMQETDRRMQETDRRIQELAQQMRETDREINETQQMIRELRACTQGLERRSRDLEQEFVQRRSEFEKGLEQGRRAFEQQMKEINRQIGRLGSRLGDFVESMVEPALVGLFQSRGLPVHQVLRRVAALDDQRRVVSEFDFLVVNIEVVVGIECKTNATVEDVREHLNRLSQLKRWYPQYAGYRIQGAIAAMRFEEGVETFAMREGLYVLAQSGESIEIRNGPGFVPREW